MSILETIGNTPLIRLRGPSEATGCEILGKCEFMNPGGSVKDRIGQSMDLEQALGQLSDEDRMVVWLYDVEGYKHQEIAAMVGKTESYSKTRLNRARKRLRELISSGAEPDETDRTANATL